MELYVGNGGRFGQTNIMSKDVNVWAEAEPD